MHASPHPQVAFLNFWASWCPPCRAEARLREQVWQRYKDRSVVFLGVDIQDTEGAARRFLREFGNTYSNGRDPQDQTAIDFGVYGIPELSEVVEGDHSAFDKKSKHCSADPPVP